MTFGKLNLINLYIIPASIFGRILLPSKQDYKQEYQLQINKFMRRFIHVESPDTVAAGHGHGGSTGASLQI